MSTFLELCQELISETGIAGGEPDQLTTVVAQTGDLYNAVKWTRNACLQVDNLWHNWKYLWFAHADTLDADSQLPTLPAFDVRRWDRASFYLDKGTANPRFLKYEEWSVFRARAGVVQTSPPSIISVKPDNTLIVDSLADDDYDFSAEGWRRPVVLAADDDEPLMPEDFHRIIVCRAMITYADKNDAPEVLEGAQAEYVDILDKLQSDQLDGQEFDRMSTQDVPLSMEVPGYGDTGNLYPTR